MDYDRTTWTIIIAIAIIGLVGAVLFWAGLVYSHEVVQMSIRNRLEMVLVKWETGNTPLERLLTVTKDGKENLVVGVGHDIKPHDDLQLGDRITLNEMNTLLQTDLDEALEDAYDLLGSSRRHPVEVRLVVAAMCFQLGKKGTGRFSKMFAAIDQKDYSAAADEMLNSLWARQTTRRAEVMASIMRGVGE